MIPKMSQLLPQGLKRALRKALLDSEQPTVAEGWEQYAQQRKGQIGVGDEWNDPKIIGMDVKPEEVVATLDWEVFGPFLGSVDTLVEIGPGGGRFTEILLPRCNRLIALDTSQGMLDILAKRFSANPKLECRLGDGKGLTGIANGAVDAVFCYGVFVHLQHWDIFNYLRESCRVLKPGGKAVLHHANTFSELGWARFLHEVPLQLNRHKLPGTFSVMTPELMSAFSSHAGLELVRYVTHVVRRDGISLLHKPG